MRIIITDHVRKRLRADRQAGITAADIVGAAAGLPGRIPAATRFRGFSAASGRVFDFVAKDVEIGRLVITIIGK